MDRMSKIISWLAGLILCITLSVPGYAAGEPLRACVTVPELGGLVKTVGGDLVTVTVFAKGTEDPHYLDARPSFIKALSEADLYVEVGLDLETGWAPLLLHSSRNQRIQLGQLGFIDASQVIEPVDIPTGTVDRSMGDVHPRGNPHYLADPLNGLKVAALLRNRMSSLQPANKEKFADNFERFRKRLGEAMVGAELSAKYDFEKLALLHQQGKLNAFLQQQGDLERLSGWFGKMVPHYGAVIVTYHKSWPYFAKRFGLTIAEHLEPKPGIPPGPGHLLEVIRTIKSRQIRVLLLEPWINLQAAQSVANKTGINIVQAATSVSAGPAQYDYLDAVTTVVEKIAKGFEAN